MHKKLRKDRACCSWDILEDRQTEARTHTHTHTYTHRRTHHNTLHPPKGWSNNYLVLGNVYQIWSA